MKDPKSYSNGYARCWILLLFLIYPISTIGQDMSSLKVTVKFNNAPLKTAMDTIESKTGNNYHFTCLASLLSGKAPVTVDFRNISLAMVLDSIFHFRDIAWESGGKLILLREQQFNHTQKAVESIAESKKQIPSRPPSPINLDSAVVYGYVATTPRFYTGNATTIIGADIAEQPVSNPLLALQGRVPGLFISSTGGISGKEVKVQLRGRNSIMSGTDPLFILDGVPVIPFMTQALGSKVWKDKASTLSFINPTDIESIEVLKDADATAIYGSRGGSGVIIINTKKAAPGKMTLSLDYNHGWETVPRRVHLLNTTQYLAMRREAVLNDGANPSGNDMTKWDTTRYTDWQKEIIGHAADVYNVHSSVTGGNENMQYLVSGNYQKEGTVFPGAFSTEKSAIHFSTVGSSPNKRFKTVVMGNYSTDHAALPFADMMQYITLPPNTPPVHNKDGSLNFGFLNPYISLIGPLFTADIKNLTGNVQLSYRWKDFTFKGSFGDYLLIGNSNTKTPIESYAPDVRDARTGSYTTYHYQSSSRIFEPQITYDSYVLGGKLDALVGGTVQGWSEQREMINATGFKEDALLGNLLYAGSIQAGESAQSEYRYGALFGRVGYQLENKYMAHVSIRRDASSRFGENRRHALFWAVGTGWIFSEEPFMQSFRKVLSYGKLRGSYGTTGNDQIGDYQYLAQYQRVEGTYQGSTGLQPYSVPNKDFAWEITKKLELGLELGFLKDRYFFKGSYYRNISTNQLVDYSLPEITGANSTYGNIDARVLNAGWEFEVRGQFISTKDFSWSGNLNVSLPKNKLLRYPGELPPSMKDVLGVSLTQVKVFQSKGVDDSTGGYLFNDGSGQAVLAKDGLPRMVPIDLAPRYYGGFGSNVQYKGVALDLFFQFVKQTGVRDVFDPVYMPGYAHNQDVAVLDRKQIGQSGGRYQRFTQNGVLRNGYLMALNSDLYYTDASYLRLKTLSLSYRLNANKWYMKDARVYLQGENLFTITPYKGLDPEVQSRDVLPSLRTIRIGMEVHF